MASALLEELRGALREHYAVESEVGRGGMATVFVAEDLKHGRRVAIKVLSPELSSSMDGDRFKREIQIAARLSHPHILPVFDSGEANGLLYYVMPFVEGESLRGRLRRETQLAIEDAIAITCEVADALSYAHSFGVVHRDIKPENILLHGGHAVVADFGIASVIQDAGGEKLTQTGMSVGTAAYMSPEQFSGQHVDGRSDMYSLACVLYEMLVGEVPFTGPNAVAIMARHTMELPPSIQIVRGTVPDELEGAIMHALEKVPADRFATVAQFKEALLGRGATSAYVRRTRGYTKQLETHVARSMIVRRRRRRTLVAGGVAIALLASGSLAGRYYWLRGHGHLVAQAGQAMGDASPRRIGVLYFADASKNGELRFLADGLTESLIQQLSQVPVLDVVSANGVRPYRGTDIDVDSIARALRIGSLVRGEITSAGKGAKLTVRLVDPASDVEISRKSFKVDTANIVALQEQVATEVAQFLRERLGAEVRLKERRATARNADAWLLLQRAEKRRKDADSAFALGESDRGFANLDTADTYLVRAEALDPEWTQPTVARASLAYRRLRAMRTQPAQSAPVIDSGLVFVERVLARDPRSADAYELRGELRYRRFTLHLIPDAAEADRTLAAAEQDLLRAVDLNPSQAGAWATLSSLYYRIPNPQKANQAAREAYRADAYLANAEDILQRLFWTSHDTEAYPDAAQWCDEGRRRFPHNFFFTECALWMMTTKAARQDPDSAWRIYAALQRVTPPPSWPFESRNGEILVAGALARAGLADSSRRVLLRARKGADATVDPRKELVGNEAVVRAILGDFDETISLIEQYLVAHPDHWRGFAKYTGPWWRDPRLQNHPKFKALMAGAR